MNRAVERRCHRRRNRRNRSNRSVRIVEWRQYWCLAYLDLLAEQKPEKLERAAVRWHGRLETETPLLTLAESQLALAALASLCAGEREAVEVLRRLLRRVRERRP